MKWTSAESAARFARSTHKTDFFRLGNDLVSQDNSIHCGPASSAIVPNALRLGKRKRLPRHRHAIATGEMAGLPESLDPFLGKYTPSNVLIEGTKTEAEVFGKPLEIDREWKGGLRFATPPAGAGAPCMWTGSDDASADPLRDELIRILTTRDDDVLVNCLRGALGQTGGGNISPLGLQSGERVLPDQGRASEPGSVGMGKSRPI